MVIFLRFVLAFRKIYSPFSLEKPKYEPLLLNATTTLIPSFQERRLLSEHAEDTAILETLSTVQNAIYILFSVNRQISKR